uniref:EF-hand domain-containing protein n=1 Tax=Lotharella globosa TaxID=91324 RepID=A0A7S3YX87_9EUKA
MLMQQQQQQQQQQVAAAAAAAAAQASRQQQQQTQQQQQAKATSIPVDVEAKELREKVRDKAQDVREQVSQQIAAKTAEKIHDVVLEKEGVEADEVEEEKIIEESAGSYVADRLQDRVHQMLMNIEKRIEDADKQMETLNVLDTDGDGLITEAELVVAIKDVLSEHNTEEEAQAIAKEVLSRASDKLKIGVSVKELIHLSKELRSRNFKSTEEKPKTGDDETKAESKSSDSKPKQDQIEHS